MYAKAQACAAPRMGFPHSQHQRPASCIARWIIRNQGLPPTPDSPNRGISCSLTPLQIGSTGSNPQQPLPAKPPNPAGEQPRQFNAFPTDPRRRSPPIRRCQELPDPPPGQCCSAAGRDGWRRRRIAAPARPPAPRALRSPWYDRLLPSSLAPFRCPRARFPLALRCVARRAATPGRCSRAWGAGIARALVLPFCPNP